MKRALIVIVVTLFIMSPLKTLAQQAPPPATNLEVQKYELEKKKFELEEKKLSVSSWANVLIAIFSVLLGGVAVALINYFFGREKMQTEIKKMNAEMEKIELEKEKISKELSKTIEPDSGVIEFTTQEANALEKGGIEKLREITNDLDESKSIILTLILGKAGYYDWIAVNTYVNTLSMYRTFKGVAILKRDKTFKAFFPTTVIKAILHSNEGHEFVANINEGRGNELGRGPGAVTSSLTVKTTKIDALKKMAADNLDTIPVIKEDNRLFGVLGREELLAELVLRMAK